MKMVKFNTGSNRFTLFQFSSFTLVTALQTHLKKSPNQITTFQNPTLQNNHLPNDKHEGDENTVSTPKISEIIKSSVNNFVDPSDSQESQQQEGNSGVSLKDNFLQDIETSCTFAIIL